VITLRTIREENADAFHPNQDWFDGEAFMDVELTPAMVIDARQPTGFQRCNAPGWHLDLLPFAHAVVLAHLYMLDPAADVWQMYLWTLDRDARGQRVYLGQNGRGLEIHRHLRLTDRWAIPLWEKR
jgi:hypothetical protein